MVYHSLLCTSTLPYLVILSNLPLVAFYPLSLISDPSLYACIHQAIDDMGDDGDGLEGNFPLEEGDAAYW